MRKKTAIETITIIALLLSLFGTKYVEVAEANPIHFPKPLVNFYSPINKTETTYYTSSSVLLNFTVGLFAYNYQPGYEMVDWLNYSIDGQAAIPIEVSYPNQLPPPEPRLNVAAWNGTLPRLGKGLHSIVVQGRTYFTNQVFHEDILGTTYFYVIENDSCAPTITNLSIQNKTYSTPNLHLTFSLNEDPQLGLSWLGYCLDCKTNYTLPGNITLTNLSEGNHSLIIYANDSLGDMGKSDTVFFTIALPTPLPTPEPTIEPTQTSSPIPSSDVGQTGDFTLPIALGIAVVVAVPALACLKRRRKP